MQMATKQDALENQVNGDHSRTREVKFVGGLRFDWVMAVLITWMIGGIYLDGWAHNHGKGDTSFFTPWHAFLYSGCLAITITLFASMAINYSRGKTWSKALPSGYRLPLIGAALFGLAGLGDMLWHTLFGIELNLEAL